MNSEFKAYFDERIEKDNWQCFSAKGKDEIEYEIYVKDTSVVAAYYGNEFCCALSSFGENPDNRIPGIFENAVIGIHDNNRKTFEMMFDSVNTHWQGIIRKIIFE